MSWTEEKVNKLKELWGKGNTASQIAEIIGGISRNAVIGKAHRLNLSAKIKTRAATSNQNFENSQIDKNNYKVCETILELSSSYDSLVRKRKAAAAVKRQAKRSRAGMLPRNRVGV